ATEVGRHLWAAASRGEAHDRELDGRPGLQQAGRGDAAVLEEQASGPDDRTDVRRSDDETAVRAALGAHRAVVLQDANGLAQDGAAHAVPLDEVDLGTEHVA